MEQVSVKPGEWTQQKVAALFELFPSVVTEVEDEQGTIRQVIDFAQLRQELSGFIAEEEQERYELTWPGRRRAEQLACSETDKRLVPVRQQSEDWETTENIYIEGDNLDALKLLYKSYANKIRCIYIDPPYNTGNEFIYNDRFRRRGGVPEREGQADHTQGEPAYNCIHSEWLSMMYPRLKLARELLSEDGAIFISIDDHEVANLRKLCDHLFGEDRFGGQIIVQTNKGGQDFTNRWRKRTSICSAISKALPAVSDRCRKPTCPPIGMRTEKDAMNCVNCATAIRNSTARTGRICIIRSTWTRIIGTHTDVARFRSSRMSAIRLKFIR